MRVLLVPFFLAFQIVFFVNLYLPQYLLKLSELFSLILGFFSPSPHFHWMGALYILVLEVIPFLVYFSVYLGIVYSFYKYLKQEDFINLFSLILYISIPFIMIFFWEEFFYFFLLDSFLPGVG